jgi:hypothetical protein
MPCSSRSRQTSAFGLELDPSKNISPSLSHTTVKHGEYMNMEMSQDTIRYRYLELYKSPPLKNNI